MDWIPKASLSTFLQLGFDLLVSAPPARVMPSWLGSVTGRRAVALGVEAFGQSADIPDLFRVMRLDAEAILDACAVALVGDRSPA